MTLPRTCQRKKNVDSMNAVHIGGIVLLSQKLNLNNKTRNTNSNTKILRKP